jgi:hypothetical protein
MGQLRAVRWGGCSGKAAHAPRDAEDDFFCLRFGVWYPSVDCAYRTLYRTCPGCFDCEQGRFNLKRHRPTLARGGRVLAGSE